MSGRFKYVIVPACGCSWAILVPCCVNHRDAVNALALKPVSAGFCMIKDGAVTVDGGSDTLNLVSRSEDAGIIRMTLHLAQIAHTQEAA